MDTDQRSQTDVTINNIMILAHDKNEARNSEASKKSISCDGSNTADISSNKKDIIRIEINKEMDKLFGPALERTRSGSDIEVTAGLKQKRRQCRSQEVLSYDRPLTENQTSGSSDAGLNVYQFQDLKDENDSKSPQVAILYDNQRAEIIASVTERLYNKLKRNERTVSKMESIVDKKIMQPLNELKICSNARQRLVELSQKATKNKRKISIPAATQTKKHAIRVKHQEVDIQKDLQAYSNNRNRSCTFQRDISTETVPLTPRYKEIAVGSKFGTLNGSDRSTTTENTRKTFKEAYTMTDTVGKRDNSTQTIVLPPPRRKRRISALSKYLKKSESIRSTLYDKALSPIININISPVYSVESHSSDEQSAVSVSPEVSNRFLIPDLCQNHNSQKEMKNIEHKSVTQLNIDTKVNDSENATELKPLYNEQEKKHDFSDDDEVSILPRVTIDPTSSKVDYTDFEELVLGRNRYPYNIELSPCKQINEQQKVIKFKDIDVSPAECCSAEWLEKQNDGSHLSNIIKDIGPTNTSNINMNSDITSYEEKYHNTDTKGSWLEEKGKIPNGKYNERYIKHSLSENELKEKQMIASSSSHNLHDQVNDFVRKQENKCSSLNFYEDRQNVRNGNRHVNSALKLTPTEYLKQLIQIRKDTVSADSKRKDTEYIT